jgi:hypothetical protein
MKSRFKLTALAQGAKVPYTKVFNAFHHNAPNYINGADKRKLVLEAEMELTKFKKFLGYE